MAKPHKFVVLVDTDRKSPEASLEHIRADLPRCLSPKITAAIQYACEQQHLEAWFFADAENLRTQLGRDLGSIDSSQPDQIDDPKRHLIRLLGEKVYTRFECGEIAGKLDPLTICHRSPGFRQFVAAVRNGAPQPATKFDPDSSPPRGSTGVEQT